MTRAEWLESLRLHALKRKRATWDLAWALVEGRMKGLADADFAEAAEATGYSRSHLHNLFRVGLAFPKGKANDALTFSAHRELLREPDATLRAIVMSTAVEQRWTAEDVIAYFEGNPPSVRPYAGDDRPAGKANKAPYSRKHYLGAHVQCPCGCAHVFPIKGHKVAPPKE